MKQITEEQKKKIDQESNDYANRVATSGQFTTDECIVMAKDDFMYGVEFGLSLSREKELEEMLREIIEMYRLYDEYSNGYDDCHVDNLSNAIIDAKQLLTPTEDDR